MSEAPPQSFAAPVVEPEDVTAVDVAIPLTTDVIAVEERGNVNQQRHGSAYGHIPEVDDATWEDRFYDEDSSIVAVFDYDVEKRAIFQRKATRTALAFFAFEALISAALGVFFALRGAVFSGIFFFLSAAYMVYTCVWLYKALSCHRSTEHHAAATTEGLRFDTRGTGDAHNVSLTIPYEQIDKIWSGKVSNDFRYCCCSPGRDFCIVKIKKVGAVFDQKILGLKNADAVVKLVEAMKRATSNPVPAVATLPVENEIVVVAEDPKKQDGVDPQRVLGDVI